MTKRIPTRVQRECEWCGSPFMAIKDRVRAGKGRFCSLTCSGKSIRAQYAKTPVDRFMAMVKKRDSGCWMWLGSQDSDGYGSIRMNGRSIRAHRFSYQYFVGPIPGGMLVCHRCDTPGCVNPEHLFIGSNRENMQDMVAKGRHLDGRAGSGSHLAKLSLEDVRAIRDLLAQGVKNIEIATQFSISHRTVSAIKTRKIWANFS